MTETASRAGELGAVALVLLLRAAGWLPLPAWPLLLAIGAAAGSRPWRLEPDATRRPARVAIVLAIAILAGVGYQFFTIFIENPSMERLFGVAETPPPVDGLVGNVGMLALFLVLVTIFSIGEELAFRGYLLLRLRETLGESTVATVAALGLSSVAFGAAHNWQNLPGMVSTSISGGVFGLALLLSHRDIRAAAAIHLATNVTAVFLAFFGLFID